MFIYSIHKYKWGCEKKRKQFKKLWKEGKVDWIATDKTHYIYASKTSIKIVKG